MGFIDWLNESPTKRRSVFCPYCFGELDLDHLEPVCSRHSQEQINKFPDFDKKLLKGDGYGGILGTECYSCYEEHDIAGLVLPADSVRCNAKTPHGAEKCPAIIPFAAVDPSYTTFSIAMIGLPNSGKTCYKLRLISELQAAFRQPPCRKPYSKFPVLDKDLQLPPQTMDLYSHYARPEFYSFIDRDDNEDCEDNNVLLEIYDFSGEDVYRAAKDYDSNAPIPSNASIVIGHTLFNVDAIFFFIDPEQSFKDHLGSPAYKYMEKSDYTDMNRIIRSLLTQIQMAKDINKLLKTPKIAYIFTKADSPYSMQAYTLLKSTERGGMAVDMHGQPVFSSEVQNIESREIMEQLVKKHDSNYKIIFDPPPFCSEENVRYFITSALGFGFERKEQTITKLGRPFRILDPLL